MTDLTGVLDDLAGPATGRTRLLHGKESLLHPHLPHTITGTAGFWPGALFRPAALAGITFLMAGNANLDGLALDGFFKVKLQGVTQVRAPGVAAATASTKDVAEDVAKDVGETAAATTKAATGLAIDTGVAELVVCRTLGGIRQDFVSFARLLELVLGFLIVRVTVGVILHRELTISPFDFLLVRVPGYPENFVIIALGHALKTLLIKQGKRGKFPRVFRLPEVRPN